MNVNQKVILQIQFNGTTMDIPVNPEELTISQSASNTNLNIIGIGKAVRKATPELKTLSIQSFFPAETSYFYMSKLPEARHTPYEYIDFIETIWKTANVYNNVPKLTTIGLDYDFTWSFVIENFNYTYNGGDLDVEYELEIKEYIEYGSNVQTEALTAMNQARAASTISEEVPGIKDTNSNLTYVVQSGDTLWDIAQRCTGNGNLYNELYELNKDIIGSNPRYISAGMVLTLPTGWNSPNPATRKKSTKNKKLSAQNTYEENKAIVEKYGKDKDLWGLVDEYKQATGLSGFDKLLSNNVQQPTYPILPGISVTGEELLKMPGGKSWLGTIGRKIREL